jgi:hypothetical protein
VSAGACRRCLIATAVVFAVAMSHGAIASSAASCKTTGRTIASNGQARVYRVPDADYRVYACLMRPARTVYLGLFDSEALGVRSVRLAGPSVGYENGVCQHADCRGAVIVRNLRTGVVRRSRIPRGAGLTTALVASAKGSVAWIRRTSKGVPQVRALDGDGERLLDSGPGVGERSLAIAGSTLYWSSDGAARSARLR